MFTPEELAEMVAADAEIEKEFRLTQEDLDRSRELDLEAKFQALPAEKQKLAKYQKAYYEANREKVAAQQKGLPGSQPGEAAGTSPELYAGIPRKKESRRRCWHTNDGKRILRHPYYMGQERNRQDGFEADGSGDPEF